MEIVSIIIAALALIVSVISLVKNNVTSQKQVHLQNAQTEMQIRETISVARTRVEDISIQLSTNKENEALIATLSSSLENVANAYDEACFKYLDGKVDKKRFKKAYITEIRDIVEADETKQFYASVQSKYNATKKVYNEWYNLEK